MPGSISVFMRCKHSFNDWTSKVNFQQKGVVYATPLLVVVCYGDGQIKGIGNSDLEVKPRDK